MRIFLPDEQSTLDAGSAIASLIRGAALFRPPGFQVRLVGDLGAGKTTLVRGVLRGLGYQGRVKSPTYPLLETYLVDNVDLAHFDLYRLEAPSAFTEAGFEETFAGAGIRFVEWPDKAGPLLPPADWVITLQAQSPEGRLLDIEALTTMGHRALSAFKV